MRLNITNHQNEIMEKTCRVTFNAHIWFWDAKINKLWLILGIPSPKLRINNVQLINCDTSRRCLQQYYIEAFKASAHLYFLSSFKNCFIILVTHRKELIHSIYFQLLIGKKNLLACWKFTVISSVDMRLNMFTIQNLNLTKFLVCNTFVFLLDLVTTGKLPVSKHKIW